MTQRRILPYGQHARLLECADLADSQAVHRWLDDQRPEQIAEIVPGARTLLLKLRSPLPDSLARTMIDIDLPPVETDDSETLRIPVRYHGVDLDHVSQLLGLSVPELIDHHTGQDWTVAFCGFAPGFGYLAPTVRSLPVPRGASPRTRVPAGSVALADQWSAIYPTDSPGGWQLIGSTDLRLFDANADPPATLRPGLRVRFVEDHR
ncbi:allophanate hydrolase subunit 1 [Microlunatus elymi]|uniref:Allophanate hydrolase subunit 1 n=1 Tax=Microlunatus elymi TaxID=2596828 RepID=A0A516PWY9_9ACTN|nr:allophanate hydrolase subunit 1 [Microlunatus elymi]QDP95689.1 allophanate hydrolase subunit 1 [Microlunatus elymi]